MCAKYCTCLSYKPAKGTIILEGELQKQGKINTQWSTRRVVLTKGERLAMKAVHIYLLPIMRTLRNSWHT